MMMMTNFFHILSSVYGSTWPILTTAQLSITYLSSITFDGSAMLNSFLEVCMQAHQCQWTTGNHHEAISGTYNNGPWTDVQYAFSVFMYQNNVWEIITKLDKFITRLTCFFRAKCVMQIIIINLHELTHQRVLVYLSQTRQMMRDHTTAQQMGASHLKCFCSCQWWVLSTVPKYLCFGHNQ